MADIKDKLVTVESLKFLHDYYAEVGGALDDLETENKTNYVAAINEILNNSNENIYGIINIMLSEIVGEVK